MALDDGALKALSSARRWVRNGVTGQLFKICTARRPADDQKRQRDAAAAGQVGDVMHSGESARRRRTRSAAARSSRPSATRRSRSSSTRRASSTWRRAATSSATPTTRSRSRLAAFQADGGGSVNRCCISSVVGGLLFALYGAFILEGPGIGAQSHRADRKRPPPAEMAWMAQWRRAHSGGDARLVKPGPRGDPLREALALGLDPGDTIVAAHGAEDGVSRRGHGASAIGRWGAQRMVPRKSGGLRSPAGLLPAPVFRRTFAARRRGRRRPRAPRSSAGVPADAPGGRRGDPSCSRTTTETASPTGRQQFGTQFAGAVRDAGRAPGKGRSSRAWGGISYSSCSIRLGAFPTSRRSEGRPGPMGGRAARRIRRRAMTRCAPATSWVAGATLSAQRDRREWLGVRQ